jgi:hypothetical protein
MAQSSHFNSMRNVRSCCGGGASSLATLEVTLLKFLVQRFKRRDDATFNFSPLAIVLVLTFAVESAYCASTSAAGEGILDPGDSVAACGGSEMVEELVDELDCVWPGESVPGSANRIRTMVSSAAPPIDAAILRRLSHSATPGTTSQIAGSPKPVSSRVAIAALSPTDME